MRSRLVTRSVTLATAALLATGSLAACRSNVGYAATIDGQRYSESDITDYLTPQAKPVERQGQDGTATDVPVRSVVVETLITEALYEKIAAALPGGAPSDSALNQVRTQLLGGATPEAALRQNGITGFTDSFDQLIVRQAVLSNYLTAQAQQGAPVQQVYTSITFPVTVNPRYGTWNAKRKTFSSEAGAGAPSFLTLQPGGQQAANPAGSAGTGGG